MKIIFILTQFIFIFYILFATYILYLESQRKKLIQKILIACFILLILSVYPLYVKSSEIQTEPYEITPVIFFIILAVIAIYLIHLFSGRQVNTDEKITKEKSSSEKTKPNVIANFKESILNIVEDRREKRDRRGNDRRKDGSFIKLEDDDPSQLQYKAPTLEISWHGIFSENIAYVLKKNILLPKNIKSDFFLYFYKILSNEILKFEIPKPLFGFLPFISLDFNDFQFDSGDKILICTKNLILSPNENGDIYGEDNLKNFLRENVKLNSKDFSNLFAEDLQDWFGELKKEGKAAFSTIEII